MYGGHSCLGDRLDILTSIVAHLGGLYGKCEFTLFHTAESIQDARPTNVEVMLALMFRRQ
jgi:hypothetical protein